MNSFLIIATDCEDKRWLTYLCGEFQRINLLTTPISVVDLKQHTFDSSQPTLYYTKEPLTNEGPLLFNSGQPCPNGQTTLIKDNIFIDPQTLTTNPAFSSSYDILWNTFVYLSRYEEYLAEKKGKRIQSYSQNHPRENKKTFHIPIVNILFNILENLIKSYFPHIIFGKNQKPVIELSHDLDYIKKTWQLRTKQTAFNLYNALKNILNPAICLQQLQKSVKFLCTTPNYWCFEFWETLEKSMNYRSIFYIHAKAQTKNLTALLIDPSYKVSSSDQLQNKLKEMLTQGFDIGLHGSYYSAVDTSLFEQELEIFENCLNHKVKRTRQHWLNYQEMITPYIHNQYVEQDSTLGWNNDMGFRSGTYSAYRPYDHEYQKAFSFLEIPQIVMDSHIYDYGADNIESNIIRAINLMDQAKNYKTSHFSISWHPRVCSSDYRWEGAYQRILNAI